MANAYTLTSDLIVPEVWAEVIQAEFVGKLLMRQFANVDTRLVGVPGDTINYPAFNRLEDDLGADLEAEDLTENVAQETGKLTQTSIPVTVKEAGAGFSVTDQSSLYAIGDALAEGRRQLPILISRKIDLDLGTALTAAGPTDVGNVANPFSLDLVSAAVAEFGDDATPQDMQAVIVTSNMAHLLRTASVLKDATSAAGDPVVLRGQVGTIYGVPVVQLDRGMVDGNVIVIGPNNPLQLTMKALPEVELEREAAFRRTNVYTRVHYGALRRYPENVIFIANNGTVA